MCQFEKKKKIISTEFCKGLISIGVCHTFSVSYQEVKKRYRIYLIYLINIHSHSEKQFPVQTLCLCEYEHPMVILVFFWTESKFLTFQLYDGWAGGQDGTRGCVLLSHHDGITERTSLSTSGFLNCKLKQIQLTTTLVAVVKNQ